MKINILFLFVLLHCNPSFGQWHIGATGSYARITQSDGPSGYSAEFLPGGSFGLSAGHHLSDRFFARATVENVLRGGKWHSNTTNPAVVKLYYVGMNFAPELEFRIHRLLSLCAGVNLLYFYNARHLIVPFHEDWLEVPKELFDNQWATGVHGSIKAYYKNAYGFLRFEQGLQPMNDYSLTDENGDVLLPSKQYNRTFSLGFGYDFIL